MKIGFFIFFFFISNSAFSQIKRTVIDKNTGLPVPFATIKVLNKPRGEIASEKGEFNLHIEHGDSLLISSVGYYQVVLVAEAIGQNISLVPKKESLQEVVLRRKTVIQSILIGSNIKKEDGDVAWGPGIDLKEEFAQRMELPNADHLYTLKKIFIPVDKYVCWGSLILQIYTLDSIKGVPGARVFLKYVPLSSLDIKKKKATIDIRNENLYFTDTKSFFISVTWPENAYFDRCITPIILAKKSKEPTFIRYLAGQQFDWYPIAPAMDKSGHKFERGLIISAELDELK